MCAVSSFFAENSVLSAVARVMLIEEAKVLLFGGIAMKVEQIMNREVKTCGPHDSLNKAAQIMWDTPCGAVPVVDEQGRPVGFLTDRDVCMAAYTQNKPLTELPVERAMARTPDMLQS